MFLSSRRPAAHFHTYSIAEMGGEVNSNINFQRGAGVSWQMCGIAAGKDKARPLQMERGGFCWLDIFADVDPAGAARVGFQLV